MGVIAEFSLALLLFGRCASECPVATPAPAPPLTPSAGVFAPLSSATEDGSPVVLAVRGEGLVFVGVSETLRPVGGEADAMATVLVPELVGPTGASGVGVCVGERRCSKKRDTPPRPAIPSQWSSFAVVALACGVDDRDWHDAAGLLVVVVIVAAAAAARLKHP